MVKAYWYVDVVWDDKSTETFGPYETLDEQKAKLEELSKVKEIIKSITERKEVK